MQLDVGNEPYLSTAQALCLLISHSSFKQYFFLLIQYIHFKCNFYCHAQWLRYVNRRISQRWESNAYEPIVQYAQVGSIKVTWLNCTELCCSIPYTWWHHTEISFMGPSCNCTVPRHPVRWKLFGRYQDEFILGMACQYIGSLDISPFIRVAIFPP